MEREKGAVPLLGRLKVGLGLVGRGRSAGRIDIRADDRSGRDVQGVRAGDAVIIGRFHDVVGGSCRQRLTGQCAAVGIAIHRRKDIGERVCGVETVVVKKNIVFIGRRGGDGIGSGGRCGERMHRIVNIGSCAGESARTGQTVIGRAAAGGRGIAACRKDRASGGGRGLHGTREAADYAIVVGGRDEDVSACGEGQAGEAGVSYPECGLVAGHAVGQRIGRIETAAIKKDVVVPACGG